MPFQLSPGVLVVEKDFTSIVPAVATSPGAFAGVFSWGPVLEPTIVSSENQLVQQFGKPNDVKQVFQSFFTASNFLAYTNNLLVARVDTANSRNASVSGHITQSTITVTSGGLDYTTAPTVNISAPSTVGGTTARAVAVLNSGSVSSIIITNPGSGYTSAPTISLLNPPGFAGVSAVITSTPVTFSTFTGSGDTLKIKNDDDYIQFENGSASVGPFAARYPGSLGNSIAVSIADANSFAQWEYASEFSGSPGNTEYAQRVGGSSDGIHVIVLDKDGFWTGVRNGILEKYEFLSKASDAVRFDGSNNYYRDVINNSSKYIRWMDHPTGATNWGTAAAGKSFTTLANALTFSFVGGVDDFNADDGDYQDAFVLFANDQTYDIALIPTGNVSSTVANFVIQNVAEVRKDCVVFASANNTGEPIIGNSSTQAAAIVAYRNALTSSSYGVMDSGFKQQYDRYNDKYRWVPLNGDIAGLCARTDYTNDPWFSPGGFNRGQIKNVVKLAHNPGKTERDTLYKAGVNPVVSFPGEGTVLFGDKTLLSRPSAFDRINVRRLFIILEKSIATAAKFQLFEFNDSFTRAQFRNLIEPFLRDVQGRRGIFEFRVVCDETNNTGEIIDRNEFIADIYIKPARSINFITLNFIAARSSVSFDEIGS